MVDTLKAAARRVLVHLGRAILRQRSRPYPQSDGPIVVIAPHPDDETLGCGALIARRRRANGKVDLVFLTDGDASHPGHPDFTPAELSARRRDEARAAARELGVDPAAVHFCGAPDGRLNRLAGPELAQLQHRLAALLTAAAPTRVFVPCCPDGSSEHDAALGLVRGALRPADPPPEVWTYPVWTWRNPPVLLGRVFSCEPVHRLPAGGFQAAKRRALACYRTQADPGLARRPAVLPAELVRACLADPEFFFPAAPRPERSHPSCLSRLHRRLVLAPRGYGRPAPAEVFDHEFTSGRWAHFRAPGEQARQVTVAEMLNRLHPEPAILDLGCGDGHFATLIQPHRYRRYVGADLSPAAVAAARRRPLRDCTFVEADFERWLPEERFDLILLNECLGYAHDPGALVARFVPTLAPGGRFVATHYRSGYWRALWRRVERQVRVVESQVVVNAAGQAWDIKVLQPAAST